MSEKNQLKIKNKKKEKTTTAQKYQEDGKRNPLTIFAHVFI